MVREIGPSGRVLNGLIQAAASRQSATVGRAGVQFSGDVEADLERLCSAYQNTLRAVPSAGF